MPAKRRPEALLDNTAFLIMDIGRLLRVRFDGRMRRFGLQRSEWWLLTYLWFFEGRTQQELADLLDITKGGLAKLLVRLERKGLLERRSDTHAGRASKRVFLTAKGRPVAFKVDKAAVRLVQEADSSLGHDRVDELHALLRTVRAALLQSASS